MKQQDNGFKKRALIDTNERRQKILFLVEIEGEVFSRLLSHRFKVSEKAIVRDLATLEEANLLRQTSDGARCRE